MKKFKGKAIYQPAGKAAEYATWACNFYKGCSNGCTYCYLKKGVLAHVMGGDKPELKSCLIDSEAAIMIFETELIQNLEKLREHGLFFSFTTDPMLDETISLTLNAAGLAVKYGVPVKILTKMADWVPGFINWCNRSNSDNARKDWRKMYAFGFTLAGHDELEPGASTNAERIGAMRALHEAGFKTFASIEPVIDFQSSLSMIQRTAQFCDLYKIGLESGKKYDREELKLFFILCTTSTIPNRNKIYFKDSVINALGFDRTKLKMLCIVDRDYNLFNCR